MPEITSDPSRGSIRRGSSRGARRSQRRARSTPDYTPTYTAPSYGSEKTQSPRSAPKTGSNPTGRGSAPATRVPARKRRRQATKAAETRQRVRTANRRIRRTKRRERKQTREYIERQARYHLSKGPGPFTDVERIGVEAHKQTKDFQKKLEATRKERAKREYDAVEGPEKWAREIAETGADISREVKKLPITKGGGDPISRGIQSSGYDPRKVVAEAADIVANAPSGAYITGKAIKEAALDGDDAELKKLVKDFKDTSALAAVASGDFDEALKRAKERPLSTGLEVSGVKAVVGRGAGAVMRSGALGKKAKKAASVKRESLRLYPEGLRTRDGGPKEERQYSKDVLNKAAQVVGERHARKGRKARKIRGRTIIPERAPRDPNIDRGDFIGKTGAGPQRRRHRLMRRLDTRRYAGERVRRANVTQAAKRSGALVPPKSRTLYPLASTRSPIKRSESSLAYLIADGTVQSVRTAKADLRARLDQLEKRSAGARKAGRGKGNKAEIEAIREALAVPDNRLEAVTEAAFQWAREQNARQERGVKAGAFSEDDAFARLTPTLQAHMGGRFDAKPQPTKAYKDFQELRRQEHKARKEVRALERRHATTVRHEQRQTGRAEVHAQGGRRQVKKRVAAAERVLARARRGGNAKRIAAAQRRVDYLKGPSTRTDVTRRQGGRLLRIQTGRMETERKLLAARANLQAATKARKDAYVPKGQRRERGWRLPGAEGLVTRAEVEAFLRDPNTGGGTRDPETIGHISQEPVRLNRRGEDAALYVQPSRGGNANVVRSRQRRGGAFELGRENVGGDAMARQAMKSEGIITAAELRHLDYEEFGVSAGSGGKHYGETRDEADANLRAQTHDADGNLKPGQMPLRAVNVDGLKAYGEMLRAIQDNAMGRGETELSKGDHRALALASKAVLEPVEGARGRWLGLPEDLVERMVQHDNVRTYGQLSRLTNGFKDVVLTTASPSSWLLGGASDLSFRSLMAGITPADVLRGRLGIRQTETKGPQGKSAAAALTGGGLVHSAIAAGRLFNPRMAGEHPARTILAAPWRTWKAGVYGVEYAIEHLPQYGAVGKEVRRGTSRQLEAQDLTFKQNALRLLHMHDEQIDHFASRLATDRALEARIQTATEDVIGRWGKISPEMRRAAGLGPFVQWLNAAVRYVMVTLPTKHPIKTGIIAAMMEMTAEQRAELGLSYTIPQEQRVQDYQMGMLPTKVKRVKGPDGKWRLEVSGPRTGNLLSFGTAGQVLSNPVRGVASFALPQFRGAFMAAFGVGWTGEQMVYPEWWPDESVRGMPLTGQDLTKAAIGLQLETMVPFAGMFNSVVQEKGRSALPQSTVIDPQLRRRFDQETKRWVENEGTALGGILEWLNPVSSSPALTNKGVKKAREGAAAGRVFDQIRRQSEREYFRDAGGGAPGRSAVRLKRQLTEIRESKKRITDARPNVDSDNPTPEYERLHRQERRLNERVHKLTKGKHGYRYKEPYSPGVDGGGNPFSDQSSGGGAAEDNPFGSPNSGAPSAGGGENPF